MTNVKLLWSILGLATVTSLAISGVILPSLIRDINMIGRSFNRWDKKDEKRHAKENK